MNQLCTQNNEHFTQRRLVGVCSESSAYSLNSMMSNKLIQDNPRKPVELTKKPPPTVIAVREKNEKWGNVPPPPHKQQQQQPRKNRQHAPIPQMITVIPSKDVDNFHVCDNDRLNNDEDLHLEINQRAQRISDLCRLRDKLKRNARVSTAAAASPKSTRRAHAVQSVVVTPPSPSPRQVILQQQSLPIAPRPPPKPRVPQPPLSPKLQRQKSPSPIAPKQPSPKPLVPHPAPLSPKLQSRKSPPVAPRPPPKPLVLQPPLSPKPKPKPLVLQPAPLSPKPQPRQRNPHLPPLSPQSSFDNTKTLRSPIRRQNSNHRHRTPSPPPPTTVSKLFSPFRDTPFPSPNKKEDGRTEKMKKMNSFHGSVAPTVLLESSSSFMLDDSQTDLEEEGDVFNDSMHSWNDNSQFSSDNNDQLISRSNHFVPSKDTSSGGATIIRHQFNRTNSGGSTHHVMYHRKITVKEQEGVKEVNKQQQQSRSKNKGKKNYMAKQKYSELPRQGQAQMDQYMSALFQTSGPRVHVRRCGPRYESAPKRNTTKSRKNFQ